MKTRTLEFSLVKDWTVFILDKNEYVKRPLKNGYNAINLADGTPVFIYANTMVEREIE